MSAKEHAALAQKHSRLASLYARLATAEAAAEGVEATTAARLEELGEKVTRLRTELSRELGTETPPTRSREQV